MDDFRKTQLSQLKGAVESTGVIGEGLDKLLEEANGDLHAHRGAVTALRDLAKKLETVHQHADAALESGEIPDLEQLSRIKAYITRCIECAINLSQQHAAQQAVAHGRIDAYKRSVAVTQRFHDASKTRFDKVQTAIEEKPEPGGAREPRGGRLSAAERRAEAQAAKDAEKAPEAAPAPVTPIRATKKKAPKKKRAAKKKTTKKKAG